MPVGVRSAQVVVFLMAGIGVIGTVVLIGLGHPIAAGANTQGYLFSWALAGTACFFGRRRRSVRITATVFAVLEGFVALGSAAAVDPDAEVALVRISPGPIGVLAVIAVLVLLYRPSARTWFAGPGVASAHRGPDVAAGRRVRLSVLVGALVAVVAVLGVGVWWVLGDRNTSGTPAVGDCVGGTDGSDVRSSHTELLTVGCSDPAVQAKVIADVPDTGKSSPCRQFEDAVKLDEYDGIDGRILCLRVFG